VGWARSRGEERREKREGRREKGEEREGRRERREKREGALDRFSLLFSPFSASFCPGPTREQGSEDRSMHQACA
jgi:hypothetical protein